MNLPDTHAMSPAQYEDLLANHEWGSLSERLAEFAWRKTNKRSWEDAEDLAQTAVRRAFDARYKRWNPRAQPNIFWFLGNMVMGLIANHRRKLKAGRVETPYEHEDLEDLAPATIDGADEALARRERAVLIVRELERQAATDRACTLLIALFRAEVDDPQEQAASAGLAIKAVYNARSKLRALAIQIAQTFDQGTLQ